MDKPLAAFYAVVFILIWVFDALFAPARAAALVVPGQMTPNDLAWINRAIASAGDAGSAVLARSVDGSLLTAQGKKIPLPANWSAAIPRATVAQAAGKLLARATPITLAGLTLYQLLHSPIGLNADGTTSGSLYYRTETCSGNGQSHTHTGGTVAEYCASYMAWVDPCLALIKPNYAGTNLDSVSGNTCSATWYDNAGGHTYTNSPTYGVPPGTSPVPITEGGLGDQIDRSSVLTADIADGVIKDAKTANIDFSSLDFLKPVQPTTVSAQPVVGPEEVIDVATSGTKTTTTKVQTTATPKVTGTTVGDQALEWQTADKTTKTTTDTATGVTTTETTTTQWGTSTTQQQPDYGKFAGTGPGDGYADGLSFINSKLCGGNCSAAFSCALGNCTVAERVNSLKTKYSVSPTSSGTCPALDMDLSAQGYGTHHTTEHCDLAETVRGVVATIMTLLTAAAVISIILTA